MTSAQRIFRRNVNIGIVPKVSDSNTAKNRGQTSRTAACASNTKPGSFVQNSTTTGGGGGGGGGRTVN